MGLGEHRKSKLLFHFIFHSLYSIFILSRRSSQSQSKRYVNVNYKGKIKAQLKVAKEPTYNEKHTQQKSTKGESSGTNLHVQRWFPVDDPDSKEHSVLQEKQAVVEGHPASCGSVVHVEVHKDVDEPRHKAKHCLLQSSFAKVGSLDPDPNGHDQPVYS